MKSGKRFLKRLRQGWGSQTDSQRNHLLQQAENEQTQVEATKVDAVPESKEKEKPNQPTWLVRRKNKSAMPRPKSTGYMGDFNILSADDDVEDTRDMAYDDYEVSRHGAKPMDSAKHLRGKNGYVIKSTSSNAYPNDDEEFEVDIDFSRLKVDGGKQTNGSGSERSLLDKSDQKDGICRKTGSTRDAFVMTRDVSGRAAYWQKREDDSNQPEVFNNTSSGVLKNWKTPSQIRQMKHQIETDKMDKFIYDSAVAQRAALWQKREDDHFAQMIINPDKEWNGPCVRQVLDKSHPDYGRPPKGSKTEKRGIKAHKHVVKEIGELCRIIAECGDLQDDGTVTVTFKKLFNTYIPISNKVVGILIRARKRGLLHFNGEMLYQRQDEDEVIRLFSVPDDE